MTEPATWGLRRTLLDLTDKLHLARPAVRLYELALAARSELRSKGIQTAEGVPVPPARLRAQIGPLHADAQFFLSSGQSQADLVRDALQEDGTSIDELDAILDWGCGCGRILRHWSRLPRARVFACDIDSRMVDWCRKNLTFADVTVNDISPPLPYEAGTFDLVYAFSVFTHLPEDLQHAWMHECFRVLKPGGHLLFSTLGEYYASLNRLTEPERRSFADGNLVVLYEGAAGSSLCSAYHPPDYVHRKLAGDFGVVSFRPAADDGRHDIHLFRKPASSSAAAER
ncbi:MAG: methyltransferase domain-containing protein [Gaiellaceae bacterium]